MLFRVVAICLLTVVFIGCKDSDSPTQAAPTMEERINAERPLTSVFVSNPSSGNWSFSVNGANPLKGAYAEGGYLIVESASKHYFALSLAKEVCITSHDVQLIY